MKPRKRKRRAIIRRVKQGPHKKARQALAHRLMELRESRGLTQEGLAKAAGLHRTYIGKIERETTGASIDVLGRICDALGIAIQDFFNEKIT